MAEAAEKQARWTRRQFWATTVEILALIATVCFTAYAALAASRAAKSADKAIEITGELGQRQLRAYVFPSEPKIELDSDGIAKASVPFKNTGQTPAYELTCWVVIGVAPYPLKAKLPDVPADPGQSSRIDLAAGGQVTTDVALLQPTSANDQAIIAAAKGAIYVWGRAEYSDAFGQERVTKFRLMYRGVWEGTQILSVCQEGNEAT